MGGRIFITLVIIVLAWNVKSQNVQLHYDFGEGRNHFTTTVEMFKPDKYGSTFFFVDMDYSVGDVEGISLAYWEIARAFKFWEGPFALHTEYNGGMGQWKAGDASGAFTVENAFLNGVEYSWNADDFSKGFTLQAMHKYIQGKHDASFQLTAVWYLNMLKGKLSFAGFADYWREDFMFGTDKTKFVFLAEPQLWYNFNSNFSLGSEIEVANNFGAFKGLKVMPTIGAKYTF